MPGRCCPQCLPVLPLTPAWRLAPPLCASLVVMIHFSLAWQLCMTVYQRGSCDTTLDQPGSCDTLSANLSNSASVLPAWRRCTKESWHMCTRQAGVVTNSRLSCVYSPAWLCPKTSRSVWYGASTSLVVTSSPACQKASFRSPLNTP